MTYEYHCKLCGHEWEEDQKIKEDPIEQCPICGELSAERLISKPHFVLKGTGWFKSGGY